MNFRKWRPWSTLETLHKPVRLSRPLKKGLPRRLFLEQLEERVLLSVVNWINPAGGAWNTAANWDSGVPGPGDDAVINLANPNLVTITHSTGTDTIHSLVSNAAINLSGGTLNVAGSMQVSNTFNLLG